MRRVLLLLMLSACTCAASSAPAEDAGVNSSSFRQVACERNYPKHLQGICTDGRDHIYWSFTTTLVKTDLGGRVVKQVPVGDHHGDLCFNEGRLYVAVNFGDFNNPKGNADSWVYVYDADDLAETARHKVPQVTYGAGGIAQRGERYYVVGGLPAGFEENYVYEYDKNFAFVKKHVVASGHTLLGIQTATFADGHFWFGCYGDPKITLKADADLNFVARYEFDCSLGIEALKEGRFLVASGSCAKDSGCAGRAAVGRADPKTGLGVE